MTEDDLLGLAYQSTGRLRRFALHLCGDADVADDLVQDAILRALASRRQLRDGTRALPWLFSILRSLFLTRHARAEHRRELLDTDAAEPVANLEEEMLSKGVGDEVATALATLPEAWRTCLLLCDVEGLSYDEIASVVDCPGGTVRSRIARARARLMESLRDYAARGGIGRGGRP